MILRVGVINIPTNVGPEAWEECFKETADRADLFGINEAMSPKAKRLYRRLAKNDNLGFYALFTGPNPVFYDGKFKKIAGTQYRLHGRGPYYARWPGYNAARYATVALYDTTSGPNVAHIHTHLVPRGPKVPEWWRKRARRAAIRKITRIVKRHREAGHIVVLTGDFNMTNAPEIWGIAWVADRGVDKIGIGCPKGYRIIEESVDIYPAPTDHKHGTAAEVEIQKVAA